MYYKCSLCAKMLLIMSARERPLSIGCSLVQLYLCLIRKALFTFSAVKGPPRVRVKTKMCGCYVY